MDKINFKKSEIKNTKFGISCSIVKPVNIYSAEIGDKVFIGPFVEIQKGVKIGKNTKIQSHSFICELVSIGENCFIGHGVMFINDLFKNNGPANGNKNIWSKTEIGRNVSIGSNATILPVKICDEAIIGAGAVVTKDISLPGRYAGNPAVMLKKK